MEIVKDTFQDGDRKLQIVHFDSFNEIISALDECEKDGSCRYSDYKKEYETGGSTWRFGKEFNTYEKTIEALDKGVATQLTMKYAEQYRNSLLNLESVQTLLSKAQSVKKRRVFKEDGDELCIDRILSGDPMHWQSTTKGRKSNTLRLGINCALSCGNDENEFAKMCALTVVLSDLITKCGYSVEILMMVTVHNISDKIDEGGYVIPVKRADQPLDLNAIYSMGILGLFRSVGFKALRQFIEGRTNDGLGSNFPTTQAIKDRLELNHLIEKKWTDDSTQKQLLDNLFKELQND
jgi:hypothetical protein